MKLYIDPGHGGKDPGALTGHYIEKNFVLEIGKRMRDYLRRNYKGITVYMSRSTDVYRSLSYRTNEANRLGADYFFSVHFNAASPSARGYEDFIWNGISNSSRTGKIRSTIHKEVKKVLGKYGIPNRGKKQANFHVVRESHAPAMLVETLFVTNKRDQKLMDNDRFIQDISEAYADGIAKAFNLKRKSAPAPKKTTSKPSNTSSGGTLYKIQAGAFKSKSNAQQRVNDLKRKGFSAYYYYEDGLYRIQAGAFSKLDNAVDIAKRIKSSGIGAYVYKD